MKNMKLEIKKISIFALFISLGLVLQYIESLFAPIPVPGGKIGLANIVSMVNLFMFGGVNTLIITSIRAFLGSILTGGVTAALYSVTGALMSVFVMWICKRFFYPRISAVGISVIGAVTHNIAQICVASVLFSSWYVLSYAAPMIALGLCGGIVTGFAAKRILVRYLKIKDSE